VPDDEADGLAVTAKGLSLCKLHHAAHDQGRPQPDLMN